MLNVSSVPDRRARGPVAKKAYDALGLDETVDAATVKARYKELVKQNQARVNRLFGRILEVLA